MADQAGDGVARYLNGAWRREDGWEARRVMLIIARTLVVLSVLWGLAAFEIWRVQYFPIGFEATGVFGLYSFVVATAAALAALVIAAVHVRSRKRAGFAPVAVSSAICLLVLAILITDLSLEAWWRTS